jgi:hypothetical protein
MKDWTKILSFDNLYEAEIRKQLLQNAGIESVIVNARDSLFLVGDIELYVRNEDEKKALFLLEQFEGLTKIDSFILKKPILNFQKYLKEKGFDTILKERENEKYILENYELYIANEKLNEVLPYLRGEKITEWKKVDSTNTVRQARYRVELLENNNIDSFVIKKRDSEYHLEDISIYVKNEDYDKANRIIQELPQWGELIKYTDIKQAELSENILGKNKIRAIIKEKDNEYILYVLKDKIEEAEKILELSTEWVELQRFNSFVEAESVVLLLEENSIEASILTIRDSVFIIGGYAVYVEKNNLSKSIEIITNSKHNTIEK